MTDRPILRIVPLPRLSPPRVRLEVGGLSWTVTPEEACALAEQLIDASAKAIPHDNVRYREESKR